MSLNCFNSWQSSYAVLLVCASQCFNTPHNRRTTDVYQQDELYSCIAGVYVCPMLPYCQKTFHTLNKSDIPYQNSQRWGE
jgi:hypothetical protein